GRERLITEPATAVPVRAAEADVRPTRRAERNGDVAPAGHGVAELAHRAALLGVLLAVGAQRLARPHAIAAGHAHDAVLRMTRGLGGRRDSVEDAPAPRHSAVFYAGVGALLPSDAPWWLGARAVLPAYGVSAGTWRALEARVAGRTRRRATDERVEARR